MELAEELQCVLAKVLEREGLPSERYEISEEYRPGDDVLGKILRVRAFSNTQQNSIHVIVKYPPLIQNEQQKEKNIFRFYKNEAMFYNQVLPQFQKFKQQFKSAPAFSIPRCYISTFDSDCDMIVLEDLTSSGFKLANQSSCLDLHHCILVLQEMGRFHATSLAMKHILAEEFFKITTSIQETVFCQNEESVAKTKDEIFETISLLLKKRYPNVDYAKTLKKLTLNFFGNMVTLVNLDTRLRVINHGNCWTNNLMFQYDEIQGRPLNLRWFDFQLARYSSLACDLSYFIYNCTTQELRNDEWEELLTSYHAELNETLSLLHLPLMQISRAQLDTEMSKFAAYGVGMALLLQSPSNNEELNHQKDNKLSASAIRITDIVTDAVLRGYLD